MRRRRSWNLEALGGGMLAPFLGAGLGLAALGDIVFSFGVPVGVTRPTGVVFDGTQIWIANLRDPGVSGTDNELVIVTTQGGIIRRITGGAAREIEKLSFDGTNVWALLSGSVVERLDGDGNPIASFSTVESVGIAIDPVGGHVWDLQGTNGGAPSRAIRQRDFAGNTLQTIMTVNAHTGWSGLAWDGCTLWASDTSSDTLFRIDPMTGFVVQRLGAPGPESQGLDFDGTYLLVSDTGTDTIYQVEIGPVVLGLTTCVPSRGSPPAPDAGVIDGGDADGGAADAPSDAAEIDAGALDAALLDAGIPLPDARRPDADREIDAGGANERDAGTLDGADDVETDGAPSTGDEGGGCGCRTRGGKVRVRATDLGWTVAVLAGMLFSARARRRRVGGIGYLRRVRVE